MAVIFRYFECNKNTTVDEMDTVMDVHKLLKDRAMKKFYFQSKISAILFSKFSTVLQR